MLKSIIPKLPSINLEETKRYYSQLGFTPLYEFKDYLIMRRDSVEIHFFLHENINKASNYAMCYIRVEAIEELYDEIVKSKMSLDATDQLEIKPWNQKEFSVVDNSGNLITFGEPVLEAV